MIKIFFDNNYKTNNNCINNNINKKDNNIKNRLR